MKDYDDVENRIDSELTTKLEDSTLSVITVEKMRFTFSCVYPAFERYFLILCKIREQR
jgi:hypothetical protein